MYPAEFGGKASALINVVTKSGSNAFHGSALEFFRNDALRRAQLLRRSGQAGAAAAPEPVRRAHSADRCARDRTFFFVSYEGQRIRAVADADVLGADRRRCAPGDFSGLAPLCDPLTRTASGAARRSPATRFRRAASIRSRWRCLQQVPLPTSGGAVQNLLAVGTQDEPDGSVHACASIIGCPPTTRSFGRFTAVRRQRHAAVRHEPAQRNARARLRPRR